MMRVGFCLPIVVLMVGLTGGVAQAQVRFESEYLLWNRNNSGDAPVVTGPGGFSAGGDDFGYESGYRFTLGGSLSYFDVEASFMSLPGWSSSITGVLTNPLSFDNPSLLAPYPANGLWRGSLLGRAARLAVESDEFEYLTHPDFSGIAPPDPNVQAPRFQSRYQSSFDSFELNLGSNRVTRPVFFAVGWRHMELDENAATLISGDFQVMDNAGLFIGDGGYAGNNGLDPNSLTEAGFIDFGGGGLTGFDPTLANPTIQTIGIVSQGIARNDLDGGQLTVGGNFAASELVTIRGFLKGGVYHNRSLGIVREAVFGIVNSTADYEREFRDRRTSATFGGGLGFDVVIAATEYINFTVGYEGLFLTGMALAGNQPNGVDWDFFGNPTYKVVHDSLFIAHGMSVGLEVTW